MMDAHDAEGNDDSHDNTNEYSEQSEYSGAHYPLGCPAEVVVEGQQMQSVCVRFIAPHPPRTMSRDRFPSSSSSSQDSPSSSSGQRVRSARSEKRRDLARSRQVSSHEDEHLPYSHEVSCSTPDLTNTGSPHNGSPSATQGTSLATASKDLDRKFQLDIENGTSYFLKRCEQLTDLNEVLTKELSRMRQKLEEYELKISTLESDNEELKIQLDKLQSEKIEWHEQGVGEWHRRVKTEEDLVSLRASLEKKIVNLTDELRKKSLEIETTRSNQASETEDVKFLKEQLKHVTETNRTLKEENERLTSEKQDLRTHKIQENSKLRSPRTPRMSANQHPAANQRLVSTWMGDSILKGRQLRNLSETCDHHANRRPSLVLEVLPPINVREASLSRRQWPSTPSVYGLN